MLSHLRLARARGSLRAPNNEVQDRALTLLDMLAEAEKVSARKDLVKALLGTVLGVDEIKAQFPEYFNPFVEAVDPETGEFDIDLVDDSKVAWSTAASEEEDESLSKWIEEHENQSVVFGEDTGQWI